MPTHTPPFFLFTPMCPPYHLPLLPGCMPISHLPSSPLPTDCSIAPLPPPSQVFALTTQPLPRLTDCSFTPYPLPLVHDYVPTHTPPLFLLLLIVASPPTPSPIILVICPPHTFFQSSCLTDRTVTSIVFHHLSDCRPTSQFPFMFSWDNKCFASSTSQTYCGIIFSFKFSGDLDSQWKVFEEMKKNNVAPNQFSYSNIVRSYLLKYVRYYLTLLLPHNSIILSQ